MEGLEVYFWVDMAQDHRGPELSHPALPVDISDRKLRGPTGGLVTWSCEGQMAGHTVEGQHQKWMKLT